MIPARLSPLRGGKHDVYLHFLTRIEETISKGLCEIQTEYSHHQTASKETVFNRYHPSSCYRKYRTFSLSEQQTNSISYILKH